MANKILIVGGVAGGATTATRLRRLDEQAEIIMFERGEYISFANCGLPYYIGGVIPERDSLLLQTEEEMEKKYKLDIRTLCEVIHINRDTKTVTVKDLQTNKQYEESYDYLILSPGARPIKPPIPGIKEASNLFTLRTIPDIDDIKTYMDQKNPKKATVIGGGFIGIEMADNLREKGLDVTLIEKANQIMTPLDFEMAAIVQQHMKEHGVTLILEDGVKSFENAGTKIILDSGKEIETDLIILAIGVQPENQLAKDAQLEIGERGGIKVNSSLQTSDPSIFAIGDAIEVTDYVNGKPTVIPLAWPANRQARLVADCINDREIHYNGTLGTSIAKVFDLTVATTGNNEKTLKKLGLPYDVIHIHPHSHVGYYPGGTPITLKLVFHPKTGQIYGAQGVGMNGVDKRIDVIATAIKGKLTVFDLPDLELSYAPPYSSAKDPVNMAGYVASNVIEKMFEQIQWYDMKKILDQKDHFILDVREKSLAAKGGFEGAVNIPLGELRDRLHELPKDKTIYIFCSVGLRGYIAARALSQLGYTAKNLDGGYKLYTAVYGESKRKKKCVTN